MERRNQPIGFMVKQINNVFEKDLNEKLRTIGITSSQCAVLDYLFHTSKDEVNQRDVERHLSLKNPTVTGILKRLDELEPLPEPDMSAEESLEAFWEYVKEREREEKIIAGR